MESSTALKRSWERCQRYGVDPACTADAILEDTEFKRYREQKLPFLREVQPALERLYVWMKRAQATVIVADTEGYILESIGDPTFLTAADKVQLSKGGCWAEPVRGTNAIGTVLVEKNPLAVVGSEHYLRENHFLSCCASPIFDPNGALIGVLDVSGYYQLYHPSFLMMVDTVARHIEDMMLLRLPERQLVISLSPEAGQTFSANIALDADGRIVGWNREARSLLQEFLPAGKDVSVCDLFDGMERLLRDSGGSANEVSVIQRSNNKMERWRAAVLLDLRPRRYALSVPATAGGKGKDQGKCKQAGPKKETDSVRYAFSDIFGDDESFLAALQLARRAASTDYTILITGESGTGKEMVAQAIHQESLRRNNPFVAINCGAVAKSLLESELFGYESGAFTGAKPSGSPGKIELANGGTLFLDEVGEMSPEMQVALLRVLQERAVMRVGGTKPISVDIRLIAATHRNLWQEVQAGRFRADLFYRLQGITIELPPLRERKDRLSLANHLLQKIALELGYAALSLTAGAKELIETYPWPGNVRELMGALRQAAFLAQGDAIEPCHFPRYMFRRNAATRRGKREYAFPVGTRSYHGNGAKNGRKHLQGRPPARD